MTAPRVVILLTVLLTAMMHVEGHDSLCMERLHITTDRHCYDQGERVWMRVFMADASEKHPVTQSQYIYVELIDNYATVHNRVTLKAENDIYCGHLDIPRDLDGGRYYMRAYTAANYNIATLESLIPIDIGQPSPTVTTTTTTTTTTAMPSYSPAIYCKQDGDSMVVTIDLGDECATQQSTFAIAVSTDSTCTGNIVASMARELPTETSGRKVLETSQRITGSVTEPQGTRFTHPVDISLIAPLDNFFLTTRSDVNGNFAFNDLEFPDSTLLIIQAMGAHENNELLLTIDFRSFPTCQYLQPDGEIRQTPVDLTDNALDPFMNDNSIKLGNITVLGMHIDKSRRDAISLMADESLSPDKIKELDASNLRDLFRRISGVTFDVDGGLHLRSNTSIYGSNLATVAVDGVIMEGEFDLSTIPIGDVLRVDVFKSGTSVIWGAIGGGGVISITTRAGSATDLRKRSTNIKKIFAPGYQPYRPFERTSGSPTLYWNPAVTTRGNRVLTLTLPAARGFHITLEGMTEDGKTIHSRQPLH